MSDSDRPSATLASSYTEMTELLQPNEANSLGRALGGVVLHWMDICGAIAALRFTNQQVVTASMDAVDFISPIDIGEIAVMDAYVFQTGTTSVDVKVDVHAEDPREGDTRETTASFLTFVAIDEQGTPVEVPELRCETENEEVLRDQAVADREEKLTELIERLDG
jgi:acyl-CoA hydrolase